MPPAKRKATVRRQVLDLKGEGSPSRPTWQTKYQQIQSNDGIHQNGECQGPSEAVATVTCPAKTNPLSGLVGNYNSDSESEDASEKPQNSLDAKVEDFLKEIQSISCEPKDAATGSQDKQQEQQESEFSHSATTWQQCYDHNSGYPYYWNVETNEVTWEMPAELKSAIASIAAKQQQQQQQQQEQVEHRQKQSQETSFPKEKKETKGKSVTRYPWQTHSDSEDEKIEMITSFGPQSGDESEEESSHAHVKTGNQKSKRLGRDYVIGPQLPIGPLLPCDSDEMEAESLIDSSYETSSLLTHRVQDTGPPGDDSFNASQVSTTHVPHENATKVNSINISSEVPHLYVNNDSSQDRKLTDDKKLNAERNFEGCDRVTDKGTVSTDTTEEAGTDKIVSYRTKELCSKDSCLTDFADDVIAEIEKETPPDYGSDAKSGSEKKGKESSRSENKSSPQTNPVRTSENTNITGISGFALLANYGDDSESEESSLSEKRKSRDSTASQPVLPVESATKEAKVKPLFPCVDTDVDTSVKESLTIERKPPEGESSGNIYGAEIILPDSTATHKAFKRKKRIEFATASYCPPATVEAKPSSPENCSAASSATTHYNRDPTSSDHRGFGFSSGPQIDPKKGSKFQGAWIEFVKTETINLNEDGDKKQKSENQAEAEPESIEESAVANEDIEDSAALLKEKVTFLSEGKEEISAVQQMAIQLETLFVAWQQGALSKVYFSRWVKEKCSDLNHHEKSAAPPGWTCLWDRKSKRYFYRNATTKAIQWVYPNAETEVTSAPATSTTGTTTTTTAAAATAVAATKAGKETDSEGGGEEMELCFTPPHLSPSERNKASEDQPSTPPPPVISDAAEEMVTSPTPPPPPQITLAEVQAATVVKTSKKRKNEDNNSSSEGDADSSNASKTNSSGISFYKDKEKEEKAPPLPPMPPPPPPPPDEPPPPLPNSPPPLPLDPDQPLPPGVDEPEYAMYRRLSPKQSFKKAQPESTSYTPDVLMTYGYGIPVASSNTQSVPPIPLQPVEYRSYVHDPVSTNHYVMSSAPSSHVIHCPAKKSKLSLSSELDSFYSDLAMLDSRVSSTSDAAATAEKTPETQDSSTVSSSLQSSVVSNSNSASAPPSKQPESSTSNGVTVKKKKKTKLAPGLSMKKKGVSSLVAKWQQVQQEVRRDLNSDDDDDDGDVGFHK